MDELKDVVCGDYICIKALEDGVVIVGMTRGKDTKLHHTEKLSNGEVVVMQFTETTSAMKIRGKAEVYTRFGVIGTGRQQAEERPCG